MSNNTIDPRVLSRHDGAQDMSIVVETEGESAASSQIGIDNGDQQFLATPTFDLHGLDFPFEQPLFLESPHSNISPTNPLSANITTHSHQLSQYTSPRFDASHPSNPNNLSNIPTEVYLGGFDQQMPQPINHPSCLNSLSLFAEYDQLGQPQDHMIAPAEQNLQPCPDIQLASPTSSSFVGGHFNDLSAPIPSDFWASHPGSDLLREYPNYGANNSSQMAATAIQHPHLLQSQSWIPTSTVPLDLPFYELSSNAAFGPANIVCSETDTIYSLVRDVGNTASSCRFPEARSTVSTAASGTVPTWALTTATESIDVLRPDQHFIASHNEINGPSFFRNDTLEAELQDQRHESDGNDSNAIRFPEIAMYQPEKLNQPTAEPTRVISAARAFGPSRPVSLPPARRGGRKGALSKEELKKRRESRRAGVCIRCRQMM